MKITLCLLIICILISLYNAQETGTLTPKLGGEIVKINDTNTWDFRRGSFYGWKPILSNYKNDDLQTNGFIVELKPLDQFMNTTVLTDDIPEDDVEDVQQTIANVDFGFGERISQAGNSSSMFIGVYKRLIGFKPNTQYLAAFELIFYSKNGDRCGTMMDNVTAINDTLILVGGLNVEPLVDRVEDRFEFTNVDLNTDLISTGNLGSEFGSVCVPGSVDPWYRERKIAASRGMFNVSLTTPNVTDNATTTNNNDTEGGEGRRLRILEGIDQTSEFFNYTQYDYFVNSNENGEVWLLVGLLSDVTDVIDWELVWLRIRAEFVGPEGTDTGGETPPGGAGILNQGYIFNFNFGEAPGSITIPPPTCP